MVEIYLIVVLLTVIVLQAVERFFYAEQVHKQQADLLKMLLSKNIPEYTQAVKAEKQPVNLPTDTDEVELSNASDESFDKFIKNINK